MNNRLAAVAALAGVVAITALAWRYASLLGDGLWYVAVGREILRTGALPSHDPFTFSAASVPWVVHMPLSQMMFAAVADRLGLRALLALGAIVTAAAVALAWLGGARTLLGRLATLPVALGVLWLVREDLSARGQVFGDLLFAALVLALVAMRRPQPWSARRLAVVAAAGVVGGSLWINLHSSALVAPAVVAVYAVATLALPDDARPSLRPFVVLASALHLGLFVNAQGHRLPLDVLRLAGSPSTHSIDLFQPPDFGSASTIVVLALVLATSALLVRGRIPEAALLVMWLLATCVARRHVEFLAIAWLATAGSLADQRLAKVRETVAVAALPVAVAIALVATAPAKDPLAGMPVKAAALVRDGHFPDNVLSTYAWGGYLDYAWAGHPKTFIDGRNQLFDNGVFDDYRAISAMAASWRKLLDIYEIHTIIWEADTPLDQALAADAAWQIAFRSNMAVVYVRAP